jgi:hypothetical protein
MKNVNFVALGMAISSIIILDSCEHANFSPHADAGKDQTITLPTSEVTLVGSATDRDGHGATPHPYWTKESGPDAAIKDPEEYVTKVTDLTEGTYIFRLTAVDLRGGEGWDEVVITVKPAVPLPNQPPTADAGPNQTITLPTSTVTLSGSGTDPEGGSLTYAWSKLSGAAATIESPATTQTNITGLLIAGNYVFRLTVTDSVGATGTSDVTVTVNAAPPVTDSNTFTTSTNIFTVSQTSKVATVREHSFSVTTERDAKPHGDLYFSFFSDTSFPAINATREYTIGYANAGNKIRVRASHSMTNDNFHNLYFSRDTTNAVIATVMDKNGKLYLKMPKTVVYLNNNKGVVIDTVHVSANVHEIQ